MDDLVADPVSTARLVELACISLDRVMGGLPGSALYDHEPGPASLEFRRLARASERRRLLARARERGSGLVAVSAWEHAAVHLDVVAHRRAGLDAGDGYLRRCELDVARTARSVTGRWTLTLPAPGGLLVDPVEGRARPATATGRRPLRLAG